MADCYSLSRDYDNAIRTIKQTLKIDTKNDRLYFNLSLAYSGIGNIGRSKKACKRAIEINPHELSYYIQLADVYEKINEHDNALKIMGLRGIRPDLSNSDSHRPDCLFLNPLAMALFVQI